MRRSSLPWALRRRAAQAWAMVRRNGDYTIAHDHGEAHWSTSYYVDAGDANLERTPDSGALAVLDPRRGGRPIPGLESGSTFTIRPRTGMLVVFPGWLQHYVHPDRPIKIIVPYAAGGAVDIVARNIGQPLAEALKQPVIVDNRPGASANIGMEMAAKAAPDGYTLLMASNGIATNMALFPNLAFDGRRDFAPIAKIGYAPLVIVVPTS